MTRGRPKQDVKQITMTENYLSEIPGEEAHDTTPEERAHLDCVVDTELSSVIVPKKVNDMGATTNSEVFGTFQLVCMEKGECETRNMIKLYPVTVINKCLRCPKFGATIA